MTLPHKGRFAPSPSGRMHLGNIYAAMLSWLSVKSRNGVWVLRIEDIDPQRCRLEYAKQLEDDLHWLGLDWDEGGTECIGNNGPYMQSERGSLYEKYLSVLNDKGLTYLCDCSRADILATQAPHESDGRVVYKGTCRPLRLTEAAISSHLLTDINPKTEGALRLYVPDEEILFEDGHYGSLSVNVAKQCGDFIVRRKDKAWAYQLAVVVDDALMGISEVVRGRDLLLSVPQQIYLYRLLGFSPPKFIHHPLLCNEYGQRLSKREKSLDMGVLRVKYSSREIIGMLAYYAGLQSFPDPVSVNGLISVFDWNRIPLEDIKITDVI